MQRTAKPRRARRPWVLRALLTGGLSVHAYASNQTHVATVLEANELAVGSWSHAGTAVYSYGYSGAGLSGRQTEVEDLASGAYVSAVDAGILHTAKGFDGRTPWMRDVSGANTPEEGGDRVLVAVSAAYRNANLWWRTDRGGAEIDDLGRDDLAGSPADHLMVRPRGGVPFDAWFDAHTHLLIRIAEPQQFLKTRTLFSDYRREAGVMVANRVLIDYGTGAAGNEHLMLRTVSIRPARSLAMFACPRSAASGVTLADSARSISVPFRLLNNHIYVEARVNGKGPFTFIVDTGGHTLLSQKVRSQANLTSAGRSPEGGAGEKQSFTGFSRVRTISIGGLEMHDQVAFAAEIYSPEIEGIPVDGMVGFELFRRLVVEIDYGRKVLTFTRPESFSPRGAGVAVPFVFYDHMPFVRGRIDELPATFDIDTGSRSELDVTSPAVARDHLRSRYPNGVRVVTGWGVGGPSKSYVVRLHSIALGTVDVDAPTADFSENKGGSFSDPSYDGNIGSAFLKRFVVTFDYRHQRMYLKRIEPLPPDIGDFDRSGMWINAARGGYLVTSVAAGSPAAEAGLEPGDVILELAGRPARAEDLSDARALLRTRPAGSRISMLVKRKRATRRILLTLRDLI